MHARARVVVDGLGKVPGVCAGAAAPHGLHPLASVLSCQGGSERRGARDTSPKVHKVTQSGYGVLMTRRAHAQCLWGVDLEGCVCVKGQRKTRQRKYINQVNK